MEARSRLTIANSLKDATASYFLKKGYSCSFELGLNSWGKLRGDVVAINLKGTLIIAEIKSSRADFMTDSKWINYLPYCNGLVFVFLPEVFDSIKEEFIAAAKPLGVGALVLDKKTGYLRSVMPTKTKLMKKKTKKLLTIRMAWRNGDISKRNSRRKRHFILEGLV